MCCNMFFCLAKGRCGFVCLGAGQVLMFIEIFAGRANVSRALRLKGFCGVALDIQYSNSMDISSDAGMAWGPKFLFNDDFVLAMWTCSC